LNYSSMKFSGPVWPWFLLAVLALSVFLVDLGRMPFIDRDEGEYVTVAREMIERSDYVIPHVNGRPYYEKPPLFFWLVVASFQLLGENETTARLPSALSGLALVALMGWFGRRHGGERLGLLSALLTATSFLIVLLARAALLDMLLTLWTTLTLLLFYQGYRSPRGPDRWYFRGAWAAMGLAFLTKGPVGVAVPVLAVLPFLFFNRTFWSTLRRIEWPWGLAIFLAVAGPWYFLAFLREGRAFWQGFFISQNVTRYTEVLLGHGAPLWFYVPVLSLLIWPWFFSALPVLWRGLVRSNRLLRAVQAEADLDFFLSLWFLIGFLFFSVAATKQPNYILPVVPPLILLAARWWAGLPDANRAGKREFPAVLILNGLVGLALSVFFIRLNILFSAAVERARPLIDPDSFEYAFPWTNLDMGRTPFFLGLLLAAGALALVVSGWRQRKYWSVGASLFSSLVLVCGLWHWTLPQVMNYLQTPAKVLARQIKTAAPDEGSVLTYGLYKPTLWFYTGGRIERIRSEENEKLTEFLSGRSKVYVLSRLSLLPELAAQPRFHLVRLAGGYVLGDNQGPTGSGVRPSEP